MTRARTDIPKNKRRRREVGVDDVVRLKEELARATEALKAAEARKTELEGKLEQARASFVENTKLVDDPNRQYPALGGRSIIDTIADHFARHPDVSFSPADIMLLLRIPTGHMDAVRVSFKRLAGRKVLKHDGYARYRWNPEHEEA